MKTVSKRLLPVLMAICLLASVVSTGLTVVNADDPEPVAADPEPTVASAVTYRVESVYRSFLKSGDIFTIPITIDVPEPGIGMVDAIVQYDDTLIQLTDAVSGEFLNRNFSGTHEVNEAPEVPTQEGAHEVWITAMDTENHSGSGVLAYLTFKAKDNITAQSESLNVSIVRHSASRSNGLESDPVETVAENGGLKINTFSSGEQIDFTVETVTSSEVIPAEGEFTVKVTAGAAEKVGMVDVKLGYNNEELSVVSAEPGAGLSKFDLRGDNGGVNPEPAEPTVPGTGEIWISAISSDTNVSFAEGDVLATLTFSAKKEIGDGGRSDIKAVEALAAYSEDNAIYTYETSVVPGGVLVSVEAQPTVPPVEHQVVSYSVGTVTKTILPAGASFTIPVEVDAPEGIGMVDLVVSYNGDALTLESAVEGEFLSQFEVHLVNSSPAHPTVEGAHEVWITGMSTTNLPDGGVIAYLTFKTNTSFTSDSEALKVKAIRSDANLANGKTPVYLETQTSDGGVIIGTEESGQDIAFMVETVTKTEAVKAGSEIQVRITTSGTEKLGMLQLKLGYDATKITFAKDKSEIGALLSGFADNGNGVIVDHPVPPVQEELEEIWITGFGQSQAVSNGDVIATLTFTANEDLEDGFNAVVRSVDKSLAAYAEDNLISTIHSMVVDGAIRVTVEETTTSEETTTAEETTTSEETTTTTEPEPEEPTATYTVGTVEQSLLPEGATVNVPVSVAAPEGGIGMVDVVVTYDKSAFELVSATEGDFLRQFKGAYLVNTNPVSPTQDVLGEIWITGMSTENLADGGVLANLQFKALKTFFRDDPALSVAIARSSADQVAADGQQIKLATKDVPGGVKLGVTQNGGEITFKVEEVTVTDAILAGTEIRVRVTASAVDKLGMLQINLKYDGESLEFVRGENGNVLNALANGAVVAPAEPTEPGGSEVWISGMGDNISVADGALVATLVFKAKVDLTVGYDGIIDSVGDTLAAYSEDNVVYELDPTVTPGGIKVTESDVELSPVTYTVGTVIKSLLPEGAMVDVPVNVTTPEGGVGMVDVVVTYDKTAFELTEVMAGDFLSQFPTHFINPNPVNPTQDEFGEVWITGMNTENVVNSGVLAHLHFKLLRTFTDDSPALDVKITKSSAAKVGELGQAVELKTENKPGGVDFGTIAVEDQIVFSAQQLTLTEAVSTGDEIRVRVTASATEKLGMFGISFQYDGENLEFVRGENGNVLNAMDQSSIVAPVDPSDSEGGEVRITALGRNNISVANDSLVATLVFRAKKDLSNGYTSTFDPVGSASAAYAEDNLVYTLTTTVKAGSVKVVATELGGPVVTYTVETVKKSILPEGATVSVPVSVKAPDGGFGMVDVVVTYDKSAFEVSGTVVGDFLAQFGTYYVNPNPEHPTQDKYGEIWITGMSTKNISGSGVLANIQFKVLRSFTEDGPALDVKIARSSAAKIGADGQAVALNTENVPGGVDVGYTEESGQITFTVQQLMMTEAIPEGTEISIKVSTSAAEKLGMLEINLNYDGESLEFVRGENGEVLNALANNAVVVPVEPSSPGSSEIRITGMNGDNISVADGSLVATLVFKTKVDLEYGYASTIDAVGHPSAAYAEDNVVYTLATTVNAGGIKVVGSDPVEPGVTYTVETVKKSILPEGATVSVPVSVKAPDGGFGMVDVVVTYDKSAFEVSGTVVGDFLAQFGTYYVNPNPEHPTQDKYGEIWITGMSTKNISGSGVLANIQFKVLRSFTEDGPALDVKIARSSAAKIGADGQAVALNTENVPGGVDIETLVAEGQSITFTVDRFIATEAIPEGTEISIKVSTSAAEKLGMLEINLNYDGESLEFVRGENGEVLNALANNAVVVPVEPSSPGSSEIRITGMNGDNISVADGSLVATLVFRTKVELPVGYTSDIASVIDAIAAYSEDNVVYTLDTKVIAGGISVTEETTTESSETSSEATATSTSVEPGETTTEPDETTTSTQAGGGLKPTEPGSSTTSGQQPTSPGGAQTGDGYAWMIALAVLFLSTGVIAITVRKRRHG